MKVTTIKVAYALTYNLGDYSNVRPSIELTAEIEPGDDEIEVRESLMDSARAHVEQEVDRALEAQGDPPHFYAGPRYILLVSERDKLAALVQPHEIEQIPDPWGRLPSRFRNHRREYILAQYNRYYDANLTIIEPIDGYYDTLPVLSEFTVIRHTGAGLIAIVPGGIRARHDDLASLGDWWQWASFTTQTRLSSHLAVEVRSEALEKNWTLYDCRDGDLGRLPTLNRPQPEPSVADADDLEHDDWDDDPEDDDDDWDDND